MIEEMQASMHASKRRHTLGRNTQLGGGFDRCGGAALQ